MKNFETNLRSRRKLDLLMTKYDLFQVALSIKNKEVHVLMAVNKNRQTLNIRLIMDQRLVRYLTNLRLNSDRQGLSETVSL